MDGNALVDLVFFKFTSSEYAARVAMVMMTIRKRGDFLLHGYHPF